MTTDPGRVWSERIIWLCVEERPPGGKQRGAITVYGDTGRGGFDDPFQPKNCQFGGWLNHYPKCGWYALTKKRQIGVARDD